MKISLFEAKIQGMLNVLQRIKQCKKKVNFKGNLLLFAILKACSLKAMRRTK